jgi:hypothetical protein
MRHILLCCASFVFIALLGGCSTTLHGSAPAREGFVYAVGSKNNLPAAWVCPVPKGAGCQPIKVMTEEE